MSRQGYLTLHEIYTGPKVYFFVLQEGVLRYYTNANCKALQGELRLYGRKVTAKAQAPINRIPNSFYVETCQIHVNDKCFRYGKSHRIELSAYYEQDCLEWGRAILGWQRQFWRDPGSGNKSKLFTQDETVRQLLEDVIEQTALYRRNSSNVSPAELLTNKLAKEGRELGSACIRFLSNPLFGLEEKHGSNVSTTNVILQSVTFLASSLTPLRKSSYSYLRRQITVE
uniref:Uncharacterized protein AlNc14C32G2971 n=1 Tax=Albugo laibachii Nc14 TaxID=890382 RepID=F0W822_9STRA|nr:conserved hypothetical protein [Albugo laibachii Nc14]|eukprot:CCA17275.1 conserved hypothetical protein [Albugo laibachii Nc14]